MDATELVLSRDGLNRLIELLWEDGYEVVGPTLGSAAIVRGPVRSIDDLPAGMTDEQAPGRYRLAKRDDGALFGYAVGPHAPKGELYPSEVTLVRLRRRADSFEVLAGDPPPRKLALLGTRACEIAAIAVQDRTLVGGALHDPDYAARREGAFVVAVQCGTAGGTCFCVSMQTGPRAERGFDLALTEIVGEPHRFVVEIGSARGGALAERAGATPAADDDVREARAIVARTAQSMGRALDTRGIKELLQGNLEHPRWDDVATRCLGCANCTLVCPTCFCTTIEERSTLEGDEATRTRKLDSCFNPDFAHVHGGSLRSSLRARYRQWLTHKLAGWIDQFGTSGCVGCGRCITWCPVGIDITEEVAAIRETDARSDHEERR